MGQVGESEGERGRGGIPPAVRPDRPGVSCGQLCCRDCLRGCTSLSY